MANIRLFYAIDPNAIVEAVNELIMDINAGQGATTNTLGAFTVAGLPTTSEGSTAYATDGCKIGELTGAGTGVPVYYSAGAWYCFGTDAAVTA